MKKRVFMSWVLGILALLILLIILIVRMEPDKPGITRAQAAKAAALFAVSRETCIQYEEETGRSHFPEKERGNWYVPYMDHLYDHGGLKEEETEASAKSAHQEITYQEAYTLACFLGKGYGDLVNLNNSNRKDVFPADRWWEIYEKAVREAAGGEKSGQADGGQAGAGQAGGGQADGEQAGGGQAGDGQADGGQADGGQADGEQEGAGQADGGQTAGSGAGDGEGIRQMDLILYGTPTNVEGPGDWDCYTSKGDLRAEGLAMDGYIDKKIRLFVRDGEVAGVGRVLSEDVTYENVWVDHVDEDLIQVHAGTIERQFAVTEKGIDPQELLHTIVDLHLESGKLAKVTVKKERIKGKVLSVGEDHIEIEGYGRLETAPGFRVYKVFGEYEERERSDILVGYDLQEFVAADGKLCAALIVEPFSAERICVLLLDDGFDTPFHQQITVTLACDGVLRFGDKGKKLQQVRLTAGSPFTIKPGDACLKDGWAEIAPDVENGGIQVDTLHRSQGTPVYDGVLEIRQQEEGLVMVNDLFLEDYLKRVVPSEMPASYEMEALKAQAVCDRTYAYRQIMDNSYSQYGAHVDDSTNFQVYNNVDRAEATDQAVDETCGKILSYQDEPAEVYYYSTSCGHGTDGSVWGGDGASTPYLQAVELQEGRRCLDLTSNEAFAVFIQDPAIPAFDASFPMYRWNALYKGTTLGRQLGLGQIDRLEILERGSGGVAKRLVATDVNGGQRTYQGQMEIRRALGSVDLEINRKDGKEVRGMSLLPSAFISIQETGTAKDGSKLFTIWGGGYGHGAGMSQNGAQGMAREGKTYREILAFFYEGTELKDGAVAEGP